MEEKAHEQIDCLYGDWNCYTRDTNIMSNGAIRIIFRSKTKLYPLGQKLFTKQQAKKDDIFQTGVFVDL
ncbi:hypothetical protein BK140_05210 [Paenibacillus macerans]|nr:hypothetical protein BK140_05210 [Paenibacillus macerans]